LIRRAKDTAEGASSQEAKKEKSSQYQQWDPLQRLFDIPPELPKVRREHIVGSVPVVQLIEEWLPHELEAKIVANLKAQASDFVQLRGKRTARFGGNPGPPFVPEALPRWLEDLCGVLAEAMGITETPPNHVLVNHYFAGEGILPHTDGPAYDPRAAILSVGSAVVFDFWRDHAHVRNGEAPALSLLLPPRSLLVFTQEAYTSHLHGIADRRYDELEGVANWHCDSQRSMHFKGKEALEWAQQQLEPAEVFNAANVEDEAPSHCNLLARGLRRKERYSLTVRRVLPTVEACSN